jgi:hypothetical protein
MSPPPGGGVIASAVAPYWPELDPSTLDSIAQLHQDWATQLDHAANMSDNSRPQFKLQGLSGDTLQTELSNIANQWRHDADEHKSAAKAVGAAARDLGDLRNELNNIIVVDEHAYQAAIEAVKKNPNARPTPDEVLHSATTAANRAATHYAGLIHQALTGSFGTDPGPPNNSNGGGNIVLMSFQPGGGQGITGLGGIPTGSGVPAVGAVDGQPVVEPSPVGTPVGSGGSAASSGTPVGSGGSAASSGTPVGSGGPATSSGTPVGSGGPATSSGTPVGSGGPTPVFSGTSKSGQNSDQSSGGATTPAGDGSGSGVTSGMGPSTTQPAPLFGGQAQPGAGGLAHGMGAGGILAPPPPGAVAGSDGGGTAVSGGGMMPMSPAAGPLAPYSPPGAGSSSSTPAAPTPAAQSGSSPTGPAAGGAAGAGAVIAASRAAKARGAAPTKRVNPDVDSARRVLAGLVKACPTRPIFWAVSVLRTPVGPQTLIAGSVGGGGYLPPEVSVPSTIRLAVLDPALPSDWATAWMGWQSPLAILVDHYERIAKVVAGVTVSAMVTSELWPSPPGCGDDFLAVRHEELVTSTVPPLSGGHRLTATDPALAARVTALDRGGDITTLVGAQLTRAIWVAAAQPDDTGLPIAVKEDADILGLVAEGAAGREQWDDYRRDVERRGDGAVMMPEIHAPRDADDSPGSVTARMWYRHYYARGRIAEMVTCWESPPISLRDIAYCGVSAGFGAVIGAVVTELEKRLPESPGPAGGT